MSKHKACTCTYDRYYECYATSRGTVVYMIEDSMSDNECNFCPRCGGVITEVRGKEADDDA